MSLAFPTGTAGPAALVRKEQPVAARRAGSLGLLVALGMLVATMCLAAAVPTASLRPGAHGRMNAVAGGRLAAVRSIDRAGARTAPVTVSQPNAISGPDTVSGPATRAVAAGRGSRSPGASSRSIALTIGKPHTAAASMAWTVSGGSTILGIAAFCGSLIAAIALATAVPAPSGGSRRSADVARIERRGAGAGCPERRISGVANNGRRNAGVARLEPHSGESPVTERRAA